MTMPFFRLAVRNVFRNRRRTLLTVLLSGTSLAALIFTIAFMRSMLVEMISISTDMFSGDAQIHAPGFLATQDVDLEIQNYPLLSEKLEAAEGIKAWAPRVYSGGMASSSSNVSGVVIWGIDKSREPAVSMIDDSVTSGAFLTGKKQEVMVGKGLAKELSLGLGDRLVLTAAGAHQSDLGQALFRVSAITDFNNREMDDHFVFINDSSARSLINVKGVHEIAIQLDNADRFNKSDDELKISLNTSNWVTQGWRELMPQLASIQDMSAFSLGFVALILAVLVVFSISNSLFMSIAERHFEFGVTLAVGTRPEKLFIQILLEGVVLGVVGALVGCLLSISIIYLSNLTGIQYSEVEFAGSTLSRPIYPTAILTDYVYCSFGLIFVSVIACIPPAFQTAKLNPVRAMHR